MLRRCFQKLVRGLFKLLASLFFQIKVESQEDLAKTTGPLIIVANHTSFLDAFLIGLAFPQSSPVFPLRFACWYKYYYFPLFYPFLVGLGAFPVYRGGGLDKVLKPALSVLERGGVVGIFPEGRRNRLSLPPQITRRDAQGKRGAAYLSIKTNTAILPILIKGTLEMSFLRFFSTGQRPRLVIKTGRIFYPQSQDLLDLDPATIEIIEKIRALD